MDPKHRVELYPHERRLVPATPDYMPQKLQTTDSDNAASDPTCSTERAQTPSAVRATGNQQVCKLLKAPSASVASSRTADSRSGATATAPS